ncbi:phosducin-like protein 2 [Pteropus alecto]|uniref:phosducin-like protein 2 n=1 Tax=Pteropus alecto TaxID=9402 RepID=UPI0007686299|nr:phosducin-like protein 2 [Pteropus alecto]
MVSRIKLLAWNRGEAGAGSGSEVTRETVARGGEVTSQEHALPQPTCPRDLKVRSVPDCQFRGRAQRARTRDAETPPGLCVGQRRVPSPQPPAGAEMPPVASRRPGLSPGQAAAAFRLLALLLLLSYCARACRGAPILLQGLQPEQELQLWNEIDATCSSFLSIGSQPQVTNALEELCLMIMGTLPKSQKANEKDNTKRFLFHYSKTRKLGNSNVEEFQGPITSQSRRYFLFRDPNEDTEWNEILRDFGILPPKEEPKDEIEEMVLHLQKEAMVKPYEKMTLAQLKEAEDEFDDEDMRAIETYREKRLQEWKALKKKQKFGELREISGNQYVNEVTNADKDVWVIIHLYRSSIPTCLLVNQHLSLLARKFPETKFVKAIVNSCIQHYHDNCLPTIFVYKNGQIEGKFIGIIECGGINLKLEELEWKLAEVGAIQTDLEENPKKGIVDVMVSSIRNTSIYDDTNSSSSDNDDTK